jgi:signal transduction histidine kinase
MSEDKNNRILLIDDTPSIHEDFRKILAAEQSVSDAGLADAKAAFFGVEQPAEVRGTDVFELTSAHQGQEGLELVLEAQRAGKPFALAFVDVRMPPGWDGVQTIKQLWRSDPELQIVICTAYSDYSWDQTIEQLGQSDQLLILKKPFDSVEIRQLANALTEKWNSSRRERILVDGLRRAEAEARAYAASLETTNRALTTAKATADRSSEVKSDFISHLSSEVHQNLATILDRVCEGERAVPGLEEVLDSSRHLMRTLDEILDITLLEAGQLELNPAPCSVAEIVERIAGDFRSVAEEKGVALEVRFPGPLPELLECDAGRLEQVLRQLVENAVTYTESGDVSVSVRLEATETWDRVHLCCDVRDTGPGLPEAMQGRVYEPFARNGHRGPGLGLALAKQLARLMGGDLSHASSPTGTTFALSLEATQVSGAQLG